jgi:hypothetical protein
MISEYEEGACKTCAAPMQIVNPAWLRWKRVKARLSLRAMSAKVRFSAPYLCDIELGRRPVPARVHEAYRKLP